MHARYVRQVPRISGGGVGAKAADGTEALDGGAPILATGRMTLDLALLGIVAQVVWIDLILSADNAVVIALACRSLPETQRRLGMALGVAAAIALRVLFGFGVSYVLQVPLLKAIGGLILIYIGIKLAGEEAGGHRDVPASQGLWSAVWTIAVADAVMSLDNVLALLAAARENLAIFTFGILLSIPLIMWGSALLIPILSRFPILAVAGGALLGWIAGEMIAADAVIGPFLAGHGIGATVAAAVCAALVLAIGLVILWRRRRRQPA